MVMHKYLLVSVEQTPPVRVTFKLKIVHPAYAEVPGI
jgi:hypothetical protein